ncbi:hypothetical protein MKW94_017252 [Papaver nudicaule]|uniref:Uncharacterized protein n=1 Tax=Papaver nudicaule TaxID=74823 RepID=A0AA41VWB0_PAPNU|nr:hypothetical protein [Papaver nudicaule]
MAIKRLKSALVNGVMDHLPKVCTIISLAYHYNMYTWKFCKDHCEITDSENERMAGLRIGVFIYCVDSLVAGFVLATSSFLYPIIGISTRFMKVTKYRSFRKIILRILAVVSKVSAVIWCAQIIIVFAYLGQLIVGNYNNCSCT